METPQNNPHDTPQNGKEPIDLDSILLPRKEIHTSASADRADAAEVLADQHAPLQPTAPKLPDTPPVPPPHEGVKPLETYQGDIQEVVEKNKVSVVSIAAAESNRQAQQPHTSTGGILKNILFILLGIGILAAAAGLIFYAITTQRSVPTPAQPPAPVITVDETAPITVSTTSSAPTILPQLQRTATQLSLPLGLNERLFIMNASTQQPMDAPTFLQLIAPDVPQSLARSLQSPFVLGVYAYHGNEPFLIFTVDSYTQAFAGMLSWEPHMQQDLAPFFPIASSTSTQPTATTTQTGQVLPTPFVDGILQNHDVREIQDTNGNIELLWTFLDAHTLVIATSDDTLHEIIARLIQTPITTPQ